MGECGSQYCIPFVCLSDSSLSVCVFVCVVVCSLKQASLVVASKRAGGGTNGRAVKKGEVLAQVSREKCLVWFKQYTEDEGEGEEVCPEGMERFCRDLGVEPEDVSIASPLSLTAIKCAHCRYVRVCASTQHSVNGSSN